MSKKKKCVNYPAAEFVANTCENEYMRLINSYNNIYNKVNILLVVFLAILVAQSGSFNGKELVYELTKANSVGRTVYLVLQLSISIISLGLILFATVYLCLLLESKSIPVIDCIKIRNEKVYEGTPDQAAMYLLCLYTKAMHEMKPIIDKKQKKYDKSVKLAVISVILFVVEKSL